MKANGSIGFNDSKSVPDSDESSHYEIVAPNEYKNMAVKSSPETIKLPTWFVTCLVAIMLGFVGTVATNFYWKGQTDEKIHAIEERAKEDRESWTHQLDYIRTQNEVMGKDLARIRIYFEDAQSKDKKWR